jgi:hypothetical protein
MGLVVDGAGAERWFLREGVRYLEGSEEIRMTMRLGTAVLMAGMAVSGWGQAAPAAQSSMPEMHEHKASAPSTTLALVVGGKTTNLTVADLQGMPQRTVTVHNAHSKVDETYTGVAVSDLLAKQGVSADGVGAKRVYHSYVRAEGTDHYFVVFSAGEVEGAVHKGDVIVALTVDGKPLMEDGRFKLVGTEEMKPARWVRNLMALTFVTVE